MAFSGNSGARAAPPQGPFAGTGLSSDAQSPLWPPSALQSPPPLPRHRVRVARHLPQTPLPKQPLSPGPLLCAPEAPYPIWVSCAHPEAPSICPSTPYQFCCGDVDCPHVPPPPAPYSGSGTSIPHQHPNLALDPKSPPFRILRKPSFLAPEADSGRSGAPDLPLGLVCVKVGPLGVSDVWVRSGPPPGSGCLQGGCLHVNGTGGTEMLLTLCGALGCQVPGWGSHLRTPDPWGRQGKGDSGTPCPKSPCPSPAPTWHATTSPLLRMGCDVISQTPQLPGEATTRTPLSVMGSGSAGPDPAPEMGHRALSTLPLAPPPQAASGKRMDHRPARHPGLEVCVSGCGLTACLPV